jgi:hypothetical protein
MGTPPAAVGCAFPSASFAAVPMNTISIRRAVPPCRTTRGAPNPARLRRPGLTVAADGQLWEEGPAKQPIFSDLQMRKIREEKKRIRQRERSRFWRTRKTFSRLADVEIAASPPTSPHSSLSSIAVARPPDAMRTSERTRHSHATLRETSAPVANASQRIALGAVLGWRLARLDTWLDPLRWCPPYWDTKDETSLIRRALQ